MYDTKASVLGFPHRFSMYAQCMTYRCKAFGSKTFGRISALKIRKCKSPTITTQRKKHINSSAFTTLLSAPTCTTPRDERFGMIWPSPKGFCAFLHTDSLPMSIESIERLTSMTMTIEQMNILVTSALLRVTRSH